MAVACLAALSCCYVRWALSDWFWQMRIAFLGMIVVSLMLIRWAFFAPQ